MSLNEKIKKTCSDIKVKDLNSEDGVDILIKKLKSLFSKDTNQAAYLAYKFESLKRPVDRNISDFINEFERLYNNNKKYEIELPAGVLAYRLLKSADIAEDKQQLARATMTSFSYDCMKKQLKAIYESISQECIATAAKVQPTYEVKEHSQYGKDRYYNSGQSSSSCFGGGRGRGRFNRGGEQNTNWTNLFNEIRKTNLLNLYGDISQCGICQSIFH